MPNKTIVEIISTCILLAKSTEPVIILNGSLYKWQGYVTDFIAATFELHSFPSFGVVIYDHTGYIPCIISDPAHYIITILKLYNKKVIFRRPQFITEIYVVDGNEQSYVFLFLRGCDIYAVNVHDDENNVLPFLPSTDARKHKLDEPNCKFEEYIVKVLHTSSAVLSYKVESYCLVLVCILRPEIQRNENTVWIVLKNHQVALRNFLVVNHVYKLMVPQTDKSNYFLDRIPLKVIFQNFSKRFKDTLHHDDLIKSRNMVLLPMNIKLWILSKNSVPNSNLRRNNSITDSVKRLKRRFVSVSGIITDMWYEESWKNHKCPYCFEETNESYSYNGSDNGDIVNDCKDETDTIPFDGILIPDVNSIKNLQNKACAFGIRSGKVSVRISLHDRYTNNMISVYLNEWKHQLYPFGLLRNATVCFTNMCAKTSKKNNIYYISTPLTQLTHLDLKATERTNLVTCNGGIKFGFSNFELIPDSMVWVPLDTDVVTKLYISKRCKRCKSVALNYKCSNVACPEFVVSNQDNYETYAFANILVKGVNKSDDFLVTLYDDEARRYFEMPDNIWIGLAALSFKSEFIYSVKKQEGHQLEESRFDFCHEQLNECFQLFCDSFMPSKRYHAVCKPMSNIKNAYICVELHEIDAARLSVTHRICCDGN